MQHPEPHADDVTFYDPPSIRRLRELIAASRARLAELEAAYTSEKTNVTALQARIFQRLRRHFEERDRLRLVVSYRWTFLDTLLRGAEKEAERVREEYHEADARTQQEYEDTGAAMESKRRLSDDEESELKSLWRKLVKLFHPDRFADDPEKMITNDEGETGLRGSGSTEPRSCERGYDDGCHQRREGQRRSGDAAADCR